MNQEETFTPNTADYNAIKQHEDIYTREVENGAWRVLPILSIIYIVGVFLYTLEKTIQIIGNPFKTNFLGPYIFIICGTFVSILVFPLYLALVYFLRNIVKKLYLGTPIVSCSVIIGFGVYSQNTGLILSGAIPLLITLLYFWCLWSDIKIAEITIKTASSQFNKKKIKIFTQFIVIIFASNLSVGVFMLAVLNYLAIMRPDYSNSKFSEVSPEEQKFVSGLLLVSLFFLAYFLEFLAAVSYIYGAAFFNQFSVKKAEYGKKDYDISADAAKHIAFSSSLGTACLGALIITIVSFIVNSTKNNAEESQGDVGALLLYCIARIIGEVLEFLTAQAYVYSAFYGKGLFASGKMGLESFRVAGIDKFINFKLTSSMLNILTFFLSAILSIGIGFLIYTYGLGVIVKSDPPSHSETDFVAIIGLFTIVILAVPFYSINSMIGGSAASQIAVFVEDPDRFRKSHKKAEKLEEYLRC